MFGDTAPKDAQGAEGGIRVVSRNFKEELRYLELAYNTISSLNARL